jgi:PKD repeat protein
VGWTSTRPLRSRSTWGLRGVLTIAASCLAVPGCARFGYDVLPLDRSSDVVGPDASASSPRDAGPSGTDCDSGMCPVATTCSDGVQNQNETGLDCGGPLCNPCPDGADCQQSSDCLSGLCGAAEVCAAPSCSDAIQNQGETAVDCGGALCSACPSCSDGIRNQDEAGLDCGGTSCAACGVNTPPLVSLSVSPGVGTHDGTPATPFQGDASATTDREDAPNALAYAWDWDEDGVTDATGVTASHVYAAAGTYIVRVAVQDTGGLSSTGTFSVIVSSDSDIVRVTTEADEAQNGATPAIPGGTGLSLREAIGYANATPGRQSILVPSGFAITLDSQLTSPTDPLGTDIIGDGARLDGSGSGPADDCIGITSPDTRLFGFEIQNCNRSPLRLGFGAARSHFSRLNIHDNALAVILNDADVQFGPFNEVSRSGDDCINVLGQNATLDWNYIHDCAIRGIELTGTSDGALVIGNVVTRSDPGILLGTGADNITLVHNVLHGHRSDALLIAPTDTGAVLRNNIFSSNDAFGVRAEDSVFASNDHNVYFANSVGTCTSCSLGAGSLTVDPRYMDAAADDYRLQPGSALIQAGIDTGNDVNGPDPGLFHGANPDIGAHETP